MPGYDRSRLAPGVVHFGLGSFHRSHQAVYFDEIARRGLSLDWGIVGVSLRTRTATDALRRQDCLFTVLERDARGDSARVVGALVDCLYAPDDPGAVLDALTDPRVQLVTLTLTGDGYDIDRETGAFLAGSASVAAQLAAPGDRPSTAYGYIVEALARRRAAGAGPFTVVSCDNLRDNGAAIRAAVVGFARLRDPELAAWIADEVTFPSSCVDRITPGVSDEARQLLARRFGVYDELPAVSESFSQWLIDDDFCAARPPLDEVGAQFVDDVEPYKQAKAWLLNGAHCALGYLGSVAGHATTHGVMSDPVFADYAAALHDEICPLLPEVDAFDVGDYGDSILSRLANPRVVDRLDRLCARGSTKMPTYLLPALHAALRAGRPYDRLVLALAGWIRYLAGHDERGRRLPLEADARAATLGPLARAAVGDVRPLLHHRDIFGDLGDDLRLVSALAQALTDLERHGVRATLAGRTRVATAEAA